MQRPVGRTTPSTSKQSLRKSPVPSGSTRTVSFSSKYLIFYNKLKPSLNLTEHGSYWIAACSDDQTNTFQYFDRHHLYHDQRTMFHSIQNPKSSFKSQIFSRTENRQTNGKFPAVPPFLQLSSKSASPWNRSGPPMAEPCLVRSLTRKSPMPSAATDLPEP